jgi:quercetin 2,3-dioxygenase
MSKLWQGPARKVEQVRQGQATFDGAGVRVTRLLSADLQQRLDPFLMLDLFGTDKPSDYIGGFPDHPHRGFETITYMLQGRMRHRDSVGNEGLLLPGGVQWMTAGRGVIHSEMPEQQEGTMEGFQLWLNLPARSKMCAPWYRDIAPQELPQGSAQGVQVRVIAGHAMGVAGAVQRQFTEPLYLDIHLEPGACFEQAVPNTHNAFLVVYRGEVAVGNSLVGQRSMAVLANSQDCEHVALQAGLAPARAILVAGQPLHEPIVQAGPFVMNTRQEIMQAVHDFRTGLLA